MAKKLDYAALFTLRKDGRYMGYWHEVDEDGNRTGPRHAIYDRDPEKLYRRIQELEDPGYTAPMTLGDAADAWSREHWERIGYKTAEAYTAPLRRIVDKFGRRPIAGITAQEIHAFLTALSSMDYARRTVQMHRDLLNMIFNYAIVHGAMLYNPCAAVPVPRSLKTTKRTLPEDAAITAVKQRNDVPFALFAQICLFAGLRRGEALALRYEDVDRARRQIHITKTVEFVGNNPHLKPPKTAAGQRDAVLLDTLAEKIPLDGNGYIFARSDGELLTKTQYRRRWAAYCAGIGYEITAHQLRHGFATILYEAGIPDKDAQELLGHSNITLTRNVYTHIRQARRQETTDRLNAFVGSVVKSDKNTVST